MEFDWTRKIGLIYCCCWLDLNLNNKDGIGAFVNNPEDPAKQLSRASFLTSPLRSHGSPCCPPVKNVTLKIESQTEKQLKVNKILLSFFDRRPQLEIQLQWNKYDQDSQKREH